MKKRKDLRRSSLAVSNKQRFSIRKLSIGVVSVLLGTTLCFIGEANNNTITAYADSTPQVVQAGSAASSQEATNSVTDKDANNAIDDYAQSAASDYNGRHDDRIILEPSTDEPIRVSSPEERADQVNKITTSIDRQVQNAENNPQDSTVGPNTDGEDASYFTGQNLHDGDEKNAQITHVTINKKTGTTDYSTAKTAGQTKQGYDDYSQSKEVEHTTNLTNHEVNDMRVNSNSRLVVNNCENGESITVTYDGLNNSYYTKTIKQNGSSTVEKVKIAKIVRTFSDIYSDAPEYYYRYDWYTNNRYATKSNPQLIIYSNPNDGFNYTDIRKFAVTDVYYDENGNEISFDGSNNSWIFVTSLNSGGSRSNQIEEVSATNAEGSAAGINVVPIKGSTIKSHRNGWWYSDINNNNISTPAGTWDTTDNPYAYIGAVAIQYKPGMKLWFGQGGNLDITWAHYQTQLISSKGQQVITYHHVQDWQKADLTIVDKDNDAVLDNWEINGGSNSKLVFEEAESRVQELLKQGYLIDKANTANSGVAGDEKKGFIYDNGQFDSDLGQDQHFVIYLTQNEAVSETRTINETITYNYADNADVPAKLRGKQAQPTVHNKLTFTRHGVKNRMTGKTVWSAWDMQSADFAAVATPTLKNYTADQDSIAERTVKPNSEDLAFNVVYSPQIEASTETKQVKETVHYVYSDGSKALADYAAGPLTFTRTVTKNDATGQFSRGAWSPAQDFVEVVSPAITGYTPDYASINQVTVNGDSQDVERTVVYVANAQTAGIKYIDDMTGKTLKTDNANGKFGSDIKFAAEPAAQIKDYEGQGYKLVSNDFNGQTYQADDTKNQFEVHLVHGTHQVVRQHDVKQTIDYVYDDGRTAADSNIQILHFTETGVHDDVTNTDTWTSAPAQSYKPTTSPVLSGYTADKQAIPTSAVNFASQDSKITVTYTANAQTAGIKYIDDTTGKTLKTDSANGKFNNDIEFSTDPAMQIKDYEDQGYELVSNDFAGQTYQADNAKNQFVVHLKHRITNISRDDTVARTIHYVYDNGQTAKPDVTQTVNFTETGSHDNVTGADTWAPAPAQHFAEVDSPAIAGYTPDQTKVGTTAVNFGDNDSEATVTYDADTQTAGIKYIDDTAGKTLKTDNANGKFGSDIEFAAEPAAQIKDYEGQGYKLVSNSFNGQKYQADNAKNQFEVHFKHKTVDPVRNVTIKETIHYIYENGKPAASDSVKTINFSRHGNKDQVTGVITWKKWDKAGDSFAAVISPTITGYTPDQKSIASISVTGDSKDIEKTVTYAVNSQEAQIAYIDDTTGKTLKTDSADGKFNETIEFGTDPAAQIKTYEGQGYKLVSSSFNGQTYQADNAKNQFVVHLIHSTKQVTREDTVTRTIHYVYNNGQTAKPDVTQTVEFTETGIHDNVTGADTWTPAPAQNFTKVDSPAITGYTPDQAKVDAAAVNFGEKDSETTVSYNANVQGAGIKYIDDTTGKTLKTESTSGKFGDQIEFSTDPAVQIKGYEGQGYKLVSSSFNGQTYQADNSQNQFEVHLLHGTQQIARQHDVKQTINYIFDNGETAANSDVQVLHFTETGVHDDVTNTDTWVSAPVQSYKAVASPVLSGYTADQKNVPSTNADFSSQDSTITVAYAANTQSAGITYIDDTIGKTLKTNSADGKFNDTIEFSTDPAAQIKDYEGQGYELVSDDFAGQAYQADNAKNQFVVHLKHGTKNVAREDTVNRTIHYVYDNGQTAKPDATQAVTFTETGIHDNVTGADTWTPAPAQRFTEVDSPVIVGYTPNQAKVDSTAVNFGGKDSETTVTYNANAQSAGIKYVDDTTGKTLKNDSTNGKFGSTIVFAADPAAQIKVYESQGYKLVSNNFKGQTYQTDNAKNQFEVHLVHGTHQVARQHDVKQTINYVYDNGKSATDSNVQVLRFTETGVHDDVTNTDTWTPAASQSYKSVTSPALPGYTADKKNVPSTSADFSSQDSMIAVTYVANAQTAGITYIDDTTGKTLKTDSANGRFGSQIDFDTNPAAQIKTYESQGYKLVSNSFNNQKYQADNTKNQFEVHLIHGTKDINREDTVTRTIHYVYDNGQTAKPDATQTVKFTETGVHDNVTGTDTWTSTPTQNFATVATPSIKGYSPDKTAVASAAVSFGDQNSEVTVTYTPVIETVADSRTVNETIHYVYEDGTKAHDDYVATPLTFTRQGKKDDATGAITWGEWTPAQDFAAVASPTIDGYVPSQESVAQITVTGDSNDIDKTVTYTAVMPWAPLTPSHKTETVNPETPKETDYAKQPDVQKGVAEVKNSSASAAAAGKTNSASSSKVQFIDSAVAPQLQASKRTAQELPQTGNDNAAGLVALGFSTMAAMFGFSIKKRKKD